jgi:hypothetical protein
MPFEGKDILYLYPNDSISLESAHFKEAIPNIPSWHNIRIKQNMIMIKSQVFLCGTKNYDVVASIVEAKPKGVA